MQNYTINRACSSFYRTIFETKCVMGMIVADGEKNIPFLINN